MRDNFNFTFYGAVFSREDSDWTSCFSLGIDSPIGHRCRLMRDSRLDNVIRSLSIADNGAVFGERNDRGIKVSHLNRKSRDVCVAIKV